jgi:hypothetical protein
VPIVERLLTEQNVPANTEASLYELYFAFATVLTFGGACNDQGRDYRVEFSQMWRSVTFPQQGTVFDYYVSPDKKKFLPWTKVPRRSSMLRGEVPGTHSSLRWKRLGSTFLRGTDLRAGIQ